MSTTGRCRCQAITYEFDLKPRWVAYCHCNSCRRSTGAPVAAYLCVMRADVRFPMGEPARFETSPGVFRSFCGKCGSPIAYEGEKYPGEIHFHLGSLEDASTFVPTAHTWVADQLPWFEVHDELKRFAGAGKKDGPPVRVGPRQPGKIPPRSCTVRRSP
jgi:hypothetical protein